MSQRALSPPLSVLSEDFDDSEDEGGFNEKVTKQELAATASLEERNKLSADQAFARYDLDGNGKITFGEFYMMLGDLSIDLPKAKAKRYFTLLDSKERGWLDKYQFHTALFASDPRYPDRTTGFRPGVYLTPKDAFFMFAKDGQDYLDFDDFPAVLKFLGIEITTSKAEAMFLQYDTDESGTIDYDEFKKIWLRLSDVRGELTKRGIKIKKMTPMWLLVNKLEGILDDEEKHEAQAMKEAQWWEDWQRELDRRRALCKQATLRAEDELARAIDAAGQVYVFGTGANDRFAGKEVDRDDIDFYNFGLIKEIWRRRVKCLKSQAFEKILDVNPQVETTVQAFDSIAEDLDDGNPAEAKMKAIKEMHLSFPQLWERPPHLRPPHHQSNFVKSPDEVVVSTPEDLLPENRFRDLNVMENTSWLWGRNIQKVVCGNAVAYALSDQGQLYVWGGVTRQWKALTPVAKARNLAKQKKTSKKSLVSRLSLTNRPSSKASREKASYEIAPENQSEEEVLLTARTQLVKTSTPDQIKQGLFERGRRILTRLFPDLKEPKKKEPDALEREYSMKIVGEYYGINVENVSKKKYTNLQYYEEVIFPMFSYQELCESIQMRGLPTVNKNKMELSSDLANAIALEKETLGLEFHLQMKDCDKKVRDYQAKKNFKQAKEVKLKMYKKWSGLRELSKEMDGYENEAFENLKQGYQNQLTQLNQEKMQNKRRQTEAIGSKTSPDIQLSGITSRGPELKTFRGDAAIFDIAVGGRHALAIHTTGRLYAWGIASSGRLGMGFDGLGADLSKPTIVPAVQSIRFKQVGCGYSHSAGITMSGQVFMWGSGATGKLGLEKAGYIECFATNPTLISLPSKAPVRQISCGSGHTAAITTDGKLYVWGCSDGGRLGLEAYARELPREKSYIKAKPGPPQKRMRNAVTPILVESLLPEFVYEVSCGVAHTGIVTRIEVNENDSSKYTGGHVYVCGSAHALGKYTPNFTLVEQLKDTHIKHISCGAAHTAVVGIYGEVFTWGSNENGCLGQPLPYKRVRDPAPVKCFYQRPKNISIGKVTQQSSTNEGRESSTAVNGKRDGNGELKCAQTLREEYPFWQVDLGQQCTIDSIQVWNRSDTNTLPMHEDNEFKIRLFPFWILVSPVLFLGGAGRLGLRQAKAGSLCAKFSKFVENPIVWQAPARTVGRYVRIQLESLNMLNVAEIEVFGALGEVPFVAKADYVSAGDAVTMAVVPSLRSAKSLEEHYLAAITADRANERILRQYNSYYDLYNRYKNIFDLGICRLCRPMKTCAKCDLVRNTDTSNLPTDFERKMPLKDIVNAVLTVEPKRNYQVDDEDDMGDVLEKYEDRKSALRRMKKKFNKSENKDKPNEDSSDDESSDEESDD